MYVICLCFFNTNCMYSAQLYLKSTPSKCLFTFGQEVVNEQGLAYFLIWPEIFVGFLRQSGVKDCFEVPVRV